MKDYPLKDSEFMNIDDELYSMINSILFPKNEHTMNEKPKLFDWYCKIRNNLSQQIHNKREQLIKPKTNERKKNGRRAKII